MQCAWKELMGILPPRIRQETDRLGRHNLQELRLRIHKPPQLHLPQGRVSLTGAVTQEDIHYVINMASRYSPWNAETAALGYLTAPGGHRIGICGEAVVKGGQMQAIRTAHSLNIRIARDFPDIARPLLSLTGSILIIGSPGWGKTTLMRDLIRGISGKENVSVVDERGELFPAGMDTGASADILTGCPKDTGIEILLRTMGPDTIAVDEITSAGDCMALLRAGWCGVRLLATAHACGKQDLLRRPVYKPIVESGLFETLVILQKDKTFRTERLVV